MAGKKSSAKAPTKPAKKPNPVDPRTYRHPEAQALLRPDVGTQAQFRKKKPPATYRYDSSLSPALDWDGQNPAREVGEWLLSLVEKAATLPAPHVFAKPESMEWRGATIEVRGLHEAVEQLKRLGGPFLNWAGKTERLSFDVPTLPLFVHERLSTKAILETLKGHKRDKQTDMFALFGDPGHAITDQMLRAYEYPDNWTNRMVLGDSLVVMSSLLHYEGMGGQVQMIYVDPPYGVRFGSNFQPFVRKRDVKHNDDQDMTREPEMVKAYRDTWELGLHSYLTYMRDRLLLARELLASTGSIFVQISDDNLHHVRELLDEVFGSENFRAVVSFKKTAGLGTEGLASVADYLLWYARDREHVKERTLYVAQDFDQDPNYVWLLGPTGEKRRITAEEDESGSVPEGWRLFRHQIYLAAGRTESCIYPIELGGETFLPTAGRSWSTNKAGTQQLIKLRRLTKHGNTLNYIRLAEDFPYVPMANFWADGASGVGMQKTYVVQTNTKIIQRCLLMTTDPGDLVVDPTCGSGTTAYVAEQWGRRWITIDTSRVPLALARQRLLTATFPYYQLKDEKRGPAGGFVYVRKQYSKGEEVGGIVSHVTLKSIANNEPPAEEVLVDRPEQDNKITRVTGPFCFEATIPTPVDWEGDGIEDSGIAAEAHGSFVDRMLEVLRRSPVLHVGPGRTVTLKNVRLPTKSLALSAEAVVQASDLKPAASLPEAVQEAKERVSGSLPFSEQRVALVFGPENGAVSEKLVFEAAREAYGKSYSHLLVIGFAIQPHARSLVEKCEATVGVPATYVQATPDLMMGDLLKSLRSSQIFSVCGLPEVQLRKAKAKKDATLYEVELVGFDVFDPSTMELDHHSGDDVPAWFLDTDYNDLCFHVSQAFFPRTQAWDDLKRALKGQYEDSVWDHLAGAVSAPFEAGEHGQIAVKVIDDRGNELLVVRKLSEAEG